VNNEKAFFYLSIIISTLKIE